MGALDLTPEEIQALKDDGLIDPGWTPGPMEDELVDDEGIVDAPLAGELMDAEDPAATEATAPSALVYGSIEPGEEVTEGTDLLAQFMGGAKAVADPAIQRFSDIALSWLPTDDKQMKQARADARTAADQLARMRLASEQAAARYPWDVFSAEMLSAKPSFGFSAAMGGTMKAVNAERARREKIAREMGVTDVEAQMRLAQNEQASEMDRVQGAASLLQSAAQLKRYSQGFSNQVGSGPFQKEMAALGIDVNTPEGMRAARRLYTLKHAKSDPATLRVLMENPDMDPFSPEFAEKVGAVTVAKADAAETEKARKLAREGIKDKRAETESDVRLEAARTTIARNKQIMEQAAKGGISGGKVPAEIQRQQLALRSLHSGIDAYEQALSAIDPRSWDQIDSKKQAKIKSMLADLVISWKEAAALGALTGPDVAMIERAMTDPFSIKGAWYGKKGLKAQLDESKKALQRRAKSIEDQYGADMGEVAGHSPAGGLKPDEVIRKTQDGRRAVFNSKTKKFVRWE